MSQRGSRLVLDVSGLGSTRLAGDRSRRVLWMDGAETILELISPSLEHEHHVTLTETGSMYWDLRIALSQ